MNYARVVFLVWYINCCLHYNHCFPQKWFDTMQECFECRVSWRHSSNTPMKVHLQVLYQGAQLKDEQSFNTSMSTVRTAVEWVFGDITSYFAFLNFRKNLKIGLSPIGKMYAVCALLWNAVTCLYGSSTGSYFDVQPPTLQEYFQVWKTFKLLKRTLQEIRQKNEASTSYKIFFLELPKSFTIQLIKKSIFWCFSGRLFLW